MHASTRLRPERQPPSRHTDFDHLAMEELRAYRHQLAGEETQVSYQRRVLDLALTGARGRPRTPVIDWGATQLAELAVGRTAILAFVPADGLPELPQAPPGRDTGSTVDTLTEAIRRLTAYQKSLEARIAAATTELIARYRERPTLALRALPLTPVVHPRDTRY